MKILIIPDIHCRNFWRETIFRNIDKVDKVIFLGDYIDAYPDEINKNPSSLECKSFYDFENNLKMLKHIISLKKNEPDKYILLCGNHTCSYIWSSFSRASRTDNKNWSKYHNFFLENLNLFNLVWIEDDVIFSHAGISAGWLKDVSKTESTIIELAGVLQNIDLEEITTKQISYLSMTPIGRGGFFPHGSCEWESLEAHVEDYDFENNKIIPVKYDSCYQVFGHTQLKESPIINSAWACLDCRKGFIIDTLTHEINECKI